MNSTPTTSGDTSTILGLIKLLRPKQWVKNGFVLAPLIFAGLFTDPHALVGALTAVVLFCIASSATYIVNDLKDIESDRRHPVKSRTRPLASGQVSPPLALSLLVCLYAVLIGAFLIYPNVIQVIAIYLVINLFYTFWLKHQPVIDIFCIAIGFVLRVYAGAMALSVPVSSWMFVTTLCLALYLASIKRRQELSQSGKSGRKVLESYSIRLVDRYAEMSATGALMFYSLFVMTARPEMVITIPFVLYGLYRYWFVVESLGGGESPTDALLSDWQLILVIVLWVGACIWALMPAGA